MHFVTFFHCDKPAGILTSCCALQAGQTTEPTGSGGIAISASQLRHLNCMMRLMKPLILMLLLAVSVEAQSLPEVARKERARKANVKSVHVFNNDDAKGAPTRPDSKAPAGRVVSAEGTPAKPAEPPAAPATAPPPEAKPAQPVVAPADY